MDNNNKVLYTRPAIEYITVLEDLVVDDLDVDLLMHGMKIGRNCMIFHVNSPVNLSRHSLIHCNGTTIYIFDIP